MIITGVCICGKPVARRYCSNVCKKRDYRAQNPRQFYSPNDWGQELQLTPESSEYYALCVQAYGKAMADYYWHRRSFLEKDRDEINWFKLCKDISHKCDDFLRSRGIDPFQY